jgi:hypothetical protein
MKEVFKCRDWRMMRWVEEWTKAQAWGFPCHPKKYPRGISIKAWGWPWGTASSSAKIRSPFNTLYFYCFMHYAFFLECQLFLVFIFVCCNKWLDPNKFFWRSSLAFYLPRTLRFSLLSFQRVFSFSRTAFSFRFLPWFLFRSCYIFLSRCILTSSPCCFFIKRVVSKKFKWCWKREKALCKKVVQEGACVDYGLGFCMSCLISFW